MSAPPARLTVVAVRHGRTALTGEVLNGCGPNAADPDLDAPGTAEIQMTAAGLARWGLLDDLDDVVCSPAVRARRTAELLAAGVQRVDTRLAEVDFGAWEGRRPREVSTSDPAHFADWLDDPTCAPPGGTSLATVAEAIRAWRAEEIGRLTASAAARVLVVAHASTVRVLVADALGLPLDRAARISVDTACAAAVSYWSDGGSALQALIPGGRTDDAASTERMIRQCDACHIPPP